MKKSTNASDIPCTSGGRLKEAREEAGLTQEKLAELVAKLQRRKGCKRESSEKSISMLENGRDMSPNYAHLLSQVLNIREEYLLLEDDYKTDRDISRAFVERADDLNNACIVMLEASLREVCARENMPVPILSDIPEIMLLEAQLRDYSDSLMWNYVKWKDASHVWSLIAQAEDAKKRRENNG